MYCARRSSVLSRKFVDQVEQRCPGSHKRPWSKQKRGFCRVASDAQICDSVVVAEDAHIGGRTILCGDEIVRGKAWGPLRPGRSAAVRGTAEARVLLSGPDLFQWGVRKHHCETRRSLAAVGCYMLFKRQSCLLGSHTGFICCAVQPFVVLFR